MVKMNDFNPQHFMCSTTTTKFDNKTRSLRTKQNWTQTWQLERVLLWHSIVNHCVHGAFLSGSVSWYGIDVVVVVAFILFTEFSYFCDCVTSGVITQFLTSCLCALNYMSNLDHLIYYFKDPMFVNLVTLKRQEIHILITILRYYEW